MMMRNENKEDDESKYTSVFSSNKPSIQEADQIQKHLRNSNNIDQDCEVNHFTMNKEFPGEELYEESPILKRDSNFQLNLQPNVFKKEALLLNYSESNKITNSPKKKRVIFTNSERESNPKKRLVYYKCNVDKCDAGTSMDIQTNLPVIDQIKGLNSIHIHNIKLDSDSIKLKVSKAGDEKSPFPIISEKDKCISEEDKGETKESDNTINYIKETKTREIIIMKNNHHKSIIKLKQLKFEEGEGKITKDDKSFDSEYSSETYDFEIETNDRHKEGDHMQSVERVYSKSPSYRNIKSNTIQLNKNKFSISEIKKKNERTKRFAQIPTNSLNDIAFKLPEKVKINPKLTAIKIEKKLTDFSLKPFKKIIKFRNDNKLVSFKKSL